MSGHFMRMVKALSALTPLPTITDEQRVNLDVGRDMALEFVEAARASEVKPDQFMQALTMAGQTGEHRDTILRGFCQKICEALGAKP